jgi:hypothetical protein
MESMCSRERFFTFASFWRVVLGISLTLGIATTALAKKVAVKPGDELSVRVVSIVTKSADFHYVFIGERRFRVSTSAEIIDRDGREIPLGRLATPCSAEVTYRLFGDHRDPMIYKIRMK